METKVSIRVQRFNIKEPVPSYDRLLPEFQSRYDIKTWKELIASLNYAIGTYTSNDQNTTWSTNYLLKMKIQMCVLFLGGFLFFASYFGISFGFAFDSPIVWQLSICGFIISIICAVTYAINWCQLRQIKRKYGDSIEPLVQNALNLLNTKYQNQCIYSIDRISGSAQFDFSMGLMIRVKIKLITGCPVYYIDNNVVDGAVSVQIIQPYNAKSNENNYVNMEGHNDTTDNKQKPLVPIAITMK
eukprot:485581_1